MPPAKKTPAPSAVSDAPVEKSYPVLEAAKKEEPVPGPDKAVLARKVSVTYDGFANRRIEHTATGVVFTTGVTHEMSYGEALDLQLRTRGEPFTVRDLPGVE